MHAGRDVRATVARTLVEMVGMPRSPSRSLPPSAIGDVTPTGEVVSLTALTRRVRGGADTARVPFGVADCADGAVRA